LSQVIYISPSYERLWQNSAAALYQNPASFLDQIHVDDRQRVRTTLASLSNGETIESFQIVNSDGTVRWIRDRIIIITGAPSIGTPSTDIFNTDTSASKSLVLDQSEKRIYQVVHIMEDMTTQQQTRIEIQQLLEQQQQFNQLRSCFVAMTSHEFRTPLTVISSSVSILQQYGSQLEESKKQRHLQRIQNKVNQIIQWLDQSLLYNRLDVSQFEFNPTPVELVQFCANLVEELQMCMTQHTIQFSAQANGLINWSDETLLHYILTNLLSNSVKFSPQGSTIRFNLICRRETMEFQIQDEGIGIPFADQSKLFESFYRASNVNNLPGTGLGLAIVKKCVELHQGEITFTSQEGVGSTFTVAIPLNLRGR
jgi:signal transduction histidine kinase